MRELESRQRLKRRIYSWPSILILALVTVLLARGAIALVAKERESAREALALDTKVTTLSEREKELTDEIDKLNTSAGVEEEIKSKYNVAEAGEHVAVIVDRPGKESTTTPEEISWWKRLWNDIIGQ